MKRLLALTIITALMIPNMALAQEPLTETYSNEFVTFQYPANWVVVAGEDGTVDLSNTQAGVEAENMFAVPSGSVHIDVSVSSANETIALEENSPEFLAGFTSGVIYAFGVFLTDYTDETSEVVIGEIEPFGDSGVSVELVVGIPLSTDMLVVALANGAVVIAEAPTSELEQWRETVFAIAETVVVKE